MSRTIKTVKLCEKNTDHCEIVRLLFDTGSTTNIIAEDIAEKFNSLYLRYNKPDNIAENFVGDSIKAIGSLQAILEIDNCKAPEQDLFNVVQKGLEDIDGIIGASIMEKYGIEVNVGRLDSTPTVKFSECPPKLWIS